ncbi:hypothetical protein EK21DRAFT_95235 [Setomelanomma holmii]|uniref:Uncharacterized protein n=1 Tax=Setomelanomma holmii TaxID=210430 RepID=A0A9P4LEA1_9PLEO|nr:hypothetical protein EK21DRAFT_95235 [Setomelanomma holmii]
MPILDLSKELFDAIINDFTFNVELSEIFQMRGVCRTFASSFNHHLLGRLSLHTYRDYMKTEGIAWSRPRNPARILVDYAGTYLLFPSRLWRGCNPATPNHIGKMTDLLLNFAPVNADHNLREQYRQDLIHAFVATSEHLDKLLLTLPSDEANILIHEDQYYTTHHSTRLRSRVYDIQLDIYMMEEQPAIADVFARAAAVGNFKAIDYYIARGLQISRTGRAYTNALKAAAATGKSFVVEYLILKLDEELDNKVCGHHGFVDDVLRPDCDCQDAYQLVMGAVATAMRCGQARALKKLLDYLLKRCERFLRRDRPSFLRMAIESKSTKVLDRLLAEEEQPVANLRNDHDIVSGWYEVIRSGDFGMARYLLDRGIFSALPV